MKKKLFTQNNFTLLLLLTLITITIFAGVVCYKFIYTPELALHEIKVCTCLMLICLVSCGINLLFSKNEEH